MKYSQMILCGVSTASLALLAGCSDNPVSNNNNTTATDAGSLGQMAFASVQSSELDSVFSSLNSTPDLLSAPELSIASPVAMLSKAQESPEQWTTTVVGGNLMLTRSTESEFDTLVVQAEATANIIEARFRRVMPLKTEHIVITDADEDGILRGTDVQYNGKAKFINTVTHTATGLVFRTGETEKSELVVSSGEDRDFDTEEDNLIISASWSKMLNNEKIGHAIYTDLDGDGILWGKKAMVYSAEVDLYNSKELTRPFLDFAKLRIKIFRTEDGIEKVRGFAGEETYKTGRVSSFWVVDSTGDSTITKGEMAYVNFKTTTPTSDAERSAHVLYVINPGENLGDESDNILYEIHIDRENRRGAVRTLSFEFIADPPVAHGQSATGGSFELNVTHFDSTTASLVGNFTPATLVATHTDREGNVRSVSIDKSGSVSENQ